MFKAGISNEYDKNDPEEAVYHTAYHAGISGGNPNRGFVADAAMFLGKWYHDTVCGQFIYLYYFGLCNRAGGGQYGVTLEFFRKACHTGADSVGRTGNHIIYHGYDDGVKEKDHIAGQGAFGGFTESKYIKGACKVSQANF